MSDLTASGIDALINDLLTGTEHCPARDVIAAGVLASLCETIEAHSLGDLHIEAERSVAAGAMAVTVNANALLALCRSEAWAHAEIVKQNNKKSTNATNHDKT